MMKPRKGILVTGSHRSGSTWVGEIISQHPNVGYIHEPFNVNYYPSQSGKCSHQFKHWFTYISEDNDNVYSQVLGDTLKYKYDLKRAINRLNQLQSDFDTNKYLEYLKVIKGLIYSTQNRLFQLRPLVKDPLSLLSAEWMAYKFNMDVVMLIRHPLAFTGSLKVKKWYFPFSDFLEQPLLMEDILHPFESEIRNLVDRNNFDIIDQSCLLWKILHFVILKFKEKHPDWIFVRHEDLSENPLYKFEEIFSHLNLDYPKNIKNKIIQYTSSNNQNMKGLNMGIKTQGKKASRIMNSQSNIKSWKNRLSDYEIERVRAKVEDISSYFYSDSDWQ